MPFGTGPAGDGSGPGPYYRALGPGSGGGGWPAAKERFPQPPDQSANPLPPGQITLSFSGGVADLIRQTPPDAFAYGDIGVLLGRAIRRSALCQGDYVLGRKPSGPPSSEQDATAPNSPAALCSPGTSGSLCKNLPVLALTDQEQNLPTRRLVERDCTASGPVGGGPPPPCFPGLPSPSTMTWPTWRAAWLRFCPNWAAPLWWSLEKIWPRPWAKPWRPAARASLCLDGLELPDGRLPGCGRPVAYGAAYPVVKKKLWFWPEAQTRR